MLTEHAPFLFNTVAMKIRNRYLELISKSRPFIGITEAAALVTDYLQRMVITTNSIMSEKDLKKIVEDIVTAAGLKKIPIETRTEFTKKHFSLTFNFDDIEAKEKEPADQHGPTITCDSLL